MKRFFDVFPKSNSAKATIMAEKTAITAINVLKGTTIGLPGELVIVGVKVKGVVGFDDGDGLGAMVATGFPSVTV